MRFQTKIEQTKNKTKQTILHVTWRLAHAVQTLSCCYSVSFAGTDLEFKIWGPTFILLIYVLHNIDKYIFHIFRSLGVASKAK